MIPCKILHFCSNLERNRNLYTPATVLALQGHTAAPNYCHKQLACATVLVCILYHNPLCSTFCIYCLCESLRSRNVTPLEAKMTPSRPQVDFDQFNQLDFTQTCDLSRLQTHRTPVEGMILSNNACHIVNVVNSVCTVLNLSATRDTMHTYNKDSNY